MSDDKLGISIASDHSSSGALHIATISHHEELHIEYTRPTFILRHDISDEELTMLENARRDGMAEAFWGFLGAGLAAVPSALEAVWKAYIENPETPLSIIHLIEIGIVLVAFAVVTAIHIIANSRGKTTKTVIETIRARRGMTP